MPRPASRCFACGSRGLMPFYEQRNLPVHHAVLLPSRIEALSVAPSVDAAPAPEHVVAGATPPPELVASTLNASPLSPDKAAASEIKAVATTTEAASSDAVRTPDEKAVAASSA